MKGYMSSGLIIVLDLVVFFIITRFYVPDKHDQLYHVLRLGFFLPIIVSFFIWFVSVLISMRHGWVFSLSIPSSIERRSDSPFLFWFSAIIQLVVAPYVAIYMLNMLF